MKEKERAKGEMETGEKDRVDVEAVASVVMEALCSTIYHQQNYQTRIN